MKQILADPGIPHKFVAGLKHRPEARLLRKSGTWRDFHADAALVEAGGHRYIMVGLARHADAGNWLARLAAPMHDLVLGRPAADDSTAPATAGH
jgi:beta-lactamase class A